LNVPIVPVCIRGAFEALPRGSAFMRPKHIEVKFLPAVKPTENDSYEDLTRQTQDAIEKCLS
jgi:long-chain acyl-CoA synthetase